MSITCFNFKPFNKGFLQGFADIYVEKWGVELLGCGIFMKGESRWLNLPSKEFFNSENESKWGPIMKFREKAHSDHFCKIALEAVDKFCSENTIEDKPFDGF
jgi:hypothetical protein